MQAYFEAALKRSGLPVSSDSKKLLLGLEDDALSGTRSGLEGLPSIAGLTSRDLAIRYRSGHALVPFAGAALEKPLLRYDFREEWNNLGYGATPLDPANPFGLAGAFALEGGDVFAEIIHRGTGEKVCDYAAVIDTPSGSTLWFNRAVGPIDGYDWVIVEEFYSRYRERDLACFPVVSEIPYGFDGAFTMRIDCDEAVASGRRLAELYREMGVPFSMAIKTGQALGEADCALMREVIAAGGSIVTHSHTHAPNWGGSREAAAWEVRESQRLLRELGVEGINYDYAVSPFHQNPPYAVEGLKDAGLRGFVGGIICNDPEFLMARAGQVPLVDGIISHSQQCMLHGETYHEAGNSIEGWKQAFNLALQTRTFFGFLDHPFSSYWYGWDSEDERLDVHKHYLTYLLSFPRVWRPSLVDALRFLDMKSQVEVLCLDGEARLSLPSSPRFEGLPPVAILIRDEVVKLEPGKEVRFEIKDCGDARLNRPVLHGGLG
jgi:hypothetical protein